MAEELEQLVADVGFEVGEVGIDPLESVGVNLAKLDDVIGGYGGVVGECVNSGQVLDNLALAFTEVGVFEIGKHAIINWERRGGGYKRTV